MARARQGHSPGELRPGVRFAGEACSGASSIVEVEQHRLVVGEPRVEVDADLAHARRQILAHEDEIAAVGRLRVAMVVHAEGRLVRAPAVQQAPTRRGRPARRSRAAPGSSS